MAMFRRWVHSVVAGVVVLAFSASARGQVGNWVSLKHVNRHLQGQVVDYTNNHGEDRRIFSPILGRPRDMYVYLPPGYNPGRAYPLILFFHLARIDEHYFIVSNLLPKLEELLLCGAFPPAIVACPDGTISGINHYHEPHSGFVNGRFGRFEDHITQEVIPFLMTYYSIRPEREAHALFGMSAGGYGAMSMTIRHRDFFGVVAVMAAPVNARYSDRIGGHLANFNPATYCSKTYYDPDEVVGLFYCGLWQDRARNHVSPVLGDGPDVLAGIIQTNPADLLFTTDLKPCELAIYVHYAGRDNWNMDAHAQSFQWLAASKGVEVALGCDPEATHNHAYFRDNLDPVLIWLGQHIIAPVAFLPPGLPAPIDSPSNATIPVAPQIPLGK
jgi:enterochelin esterase-like enzyme